MVKKAGVSFLIGIMVVLAAGQVMAQDSLFESEKEAEINWEEAVIRAKGYAAPPEDIDNPAQAQILAREGAITMAQRRLLEKIKGAKITSQQTVKNAQVESDVIKKKISGVIRGAEIVEERQFDNGAYQVILEVGIYGEDGVARTVLPRLLEEERDKGDQSPKEDQFLDPEREEEEKEEAPEEERLDYTGIIINAAGLNLKPAMYPKIYGPEDQEIYSINTVEVNKDKVIQDKIVDYTRSLADARAKSEAGDNPLIVEPKRIKNGSDIVLSTEDARLVNRVGRETGVFKDFAVIIVFNK